MGMSRDIYIGPYLVVQIPLHEVETDCCAGHTIPQGSSFCPDCGRDVRHRIHRTKELKIPLGWQDDYPKGLFSNYLYSVNPLDQSDLHTSVFLPNRYYSELGIPRLDKTGDFPFSDVDFSNMKERFEDRFAEEIAYLRRWCQVEVKVGCVSYYS